MPISNKLSVKYYSVKYPDLLDHRFLYRIYRLEIEVLMKIDYWFQLYLIGKAETEYFLKYSIMVLMFFSYQIRFADYLNVVDYYL